MRKSYLLCFFGAVLLVSAASATSAAQTSTPPHTTVKKKSTTSKSKRTARPAEQKAPTPDRIREIQSALQREGAYQGNPTGKWDDPTVAAMKTYQDKIGLSPTGKIDALTLEKLGLGSQTAGKGAPVPAVSKINPPAHSVQ